MSQLFKKSFNSLKQYQSTRNLSLLEHASCALLNEYQIPTPRFGVAKSAREACQVARDLGSSDLVVKAQVLAGGRGAGSFKNGLQGGVQIVHSPEAASEISGKMIGEILVTKQTGPEGKLCNTVMITQRKYPKREFYLGIMMDRLSGGPVLIASAKGGINIEEVAARSPDDIIKEKIDLEEGLTVEQIGRVASFVGLNRNLRETVRILQNLHCLFIRNDALLVEINPYAEDICECFYALDAKMVFDDNAEFRQKDLFAKRDVSQEDPRELQASNADLSYISMDGNIGCMVNGAGLAMATMDLIKFHGGNPANFLDFQGAITVEKVEKAFEIVTSDPKVQVVYMNVFGGIARCDEIVKGVISVAKKINLNVPVVMRLQGTNYNEAKELLKTSNLKIISQDDFNNSAELSVKMSKIVDLANQSKLDVFLQMKPEAVDPCLKTVCQNLSEKSDEKATGKSDKSPPAVDSKKEAVNSAENVKKGFSFTDIFKKDDKESDKKNSCQKTSKTPVTSEISKTEELKTALDKDATKKSTKDTENLKKISTDQENLKKLSDQSKKISDLKENLKKDDENLKKSIEGQKAKKNPVDTKGESKKVNSPADNLKKFADNLKKDGTEQSKKISSLAKDLNKDAENSKKTVGGQEANKNPVVSKDESKKVNYPEENFMKFSDNLKQEATEKSKKIAEDLKKNAENVKKTVDHKSSISKESKNQVSGTSKNLDATISAVPSESLKEAPISVEPSKTISTEKSASASKKVPETSSNKSQAAEIPKKKPS